MRRIVLWLGLGVAALLALLATAARGPENEGYRVRAVFDNASTLAKGEEVRIAGARVGTVERLSVSAKPPWRALVDLRIDDPRFAPFHHDATCRVRSEGLLAVQFVDCDPGTARQPELARIATGPGAGRHMLPVARTGSPVDLDLVTNVMRRPTTRQFSILLAELGTGLAGRGGDLNAVIRRAYPGLGETARVTRILADHKRELSQLVDDAHTVLEPLARQRRALRGLVVNAEQTARASAERRDDFDRGLERLPGMLRELRPALADAQALVDRSTPVLGNLRRAAPGLGRATTALGPFSRAGLPAARALGATADRSGPALVRSLPLTRDLRDTQRALTRPSADLAALLASFDKEGGTKRLPQLWFAAASATNGFDAVGHYARGAVLSGACSEYATQAYYGCDAQWGPPSQAKRAVAAARAPRSRDRLAVDKDPRRQPGAAGVDVKLLDYLLGNDQ